jgi:hypothetical protein
MGLIVLALPSMVPALACHFNQLGTLRSYSARCRGRLGQITPLRTNDIYYLWLRRFQLPPSRQHTYRRIPRLAYDLTVGGLQ